MTMKYTTIIKINIQFRESITNLDPTPAHGNSSYYNPRGIHPTLHQGKWPTRHKWYEQPSTGKTLPDAHRADKRLDNKSRMVQNTILLKVFHHYMYNNNEIIKWADAHSQLTFSLLPDIHMAPRSWNLKPERSLSPPMLNSKYLILSEEYLFASSTRPPQTFKPRNRYLLSWTLHHRAMQ